MGFFSLFDRKRKPKKGVEPPYKVEPRRVRVSNGDTVNGRRVNRSSDDGTTLLFVESSPSYHRPESYSSPEPFKAGGGDFGGGGASSSWGDSSSSSDSSGGGGGGD